MKGQISPLVIQDAVVASAIYSVFQKAYGVEAALIGAKDFPPLRRSITDLHRSSTQFHGYYLSQELAGVIETRSEDRTLWLDSLAVDPDLTRLGIATQLLDFMFAKARPQLVIVETAMANDPAMNLYNKIGFTVYRRWTSPEGLALVQLRLAVAGTKPESRCRPS